ncbi:MAG: RNA polymerase sigma-70 factor [Draconibacterium sp.]|nr:RNA polymerase sigma-70 factor [Bacteroidales bacterium]MCK5729717.1 RNA polymerase sigma-70 factor [Draconibacterium sp.]
MKLQGDNRELFIITMKGDEKAFEKLYRLYFPRLFSYSEKIVENSNMAKDIIQNIFIKVWENPKIIKTDNPEAFLFKMVRNASLNYIRHLKVVDNLKKKVKEKYLGEELYNIDFVGNEPIELINSELQAKVAQVMNSLPQKCREVFSLSRNEGLKNREIAKKLNISVKSVEKHISRALAEYRTNFAELMPLYLLLISIS